MPLDLGSQHDSLLDHLSTFFEEVWALRTNFQGGVFQLLRVHQGDPRDELHIEILDLGSELLVRKLALLIQE